MSIIDIARALLHEPRVLFLDEPTVGLDPRARANVLDRIDVLRAHAGVTVVLTTHYLAEADGCDRVAIIDAGRVQVLGSPQQLRAEHGPRATLDDVFLAVTGRVIDPASISSRGDLGRATDRQRSGPR